MLARQAVWPERMFSLLAGFVEAGESFEVCVAREIREEIGLTVRDVRYLGSQPWPFPRSLMVGFHALGDPDEDFSFNDGEIAEANWFTRDEVRAALAAGDWSSASESKLLLPGSISIARVIIESWAGRRLSSLAADFGQLRLDLAALGLVSVDPSANFTVGTVLLPPLTEPTNSAAAGSCSMSTSS